MWVALGTALATTVAWLLRRPPAQAQWPRIGFGIALLLFCLALLVALATVLGGDATPMNLQLHRGENPGRALASGPRAGLYVVALFASAWCAWRLLRGRR
ncbi:hypothetical protein C1932_01420 [Stenotrophomonas sp. YAU14D1_LEIMI4_1]|nr:hypothetical protein C1932_01420 [Stenotrophomonas sp. YAU14D1_LEIMI4_1]